jgi:hypothetical protein
MNCNAHVEPNTCGAYVEQEDELKCTPAIKILTLQITDF